MQCTTMDRSKLQALAAELANDIKTEADLNALSRAPQTNGRDRPKCRIDRSFGLREARRYQRLLWCRAD